MEKKPKRRLLVLIDEEKASMVALVLESYKWVRVIDLDAEEFPAPPGKRLVSDAAWEVLRQGARVPITEIQSSLLMLGTEFLSDDQRTNSERWCLAELARRHNEEEDFSE